ncbi:hypothetical protein EON65_10555 [archaeon]|nr:MAG: hypothetical protein EON65_10555 [archaeon]
MSAIDFKKMLAEERRKRSSQLTQQDDNAIQPAAPTVNEGKTPITTDERAPPKGEDGLIDGQLDIEGPILLPHALSSLWQSMSAVPDLFYVPDVITPITEETLVKAVQAGEKSWEKLRGRRLQQWGRIPSRDGSTIDTPLPPWLTTIIDELMYLNIFPADKRPNNVLINEYELDEGIMHHTDGPLYFDRVVILSLHSDCIMSFKPNLKTHEIGVKSADDVLSAVLQRRSVFVFQSVWYNQHLHGIYANEVVSYVDQHGQTVNAASIGLNPGDSVSVDTVFILCVVVFVLNSNMVYI